MTRISFDDENLKGIAAAFAERGARVRVVGGAVRDMVLGQKPKDIDVATDATPAEIISIAEGAGYRTIPTGLKHGTVTVMAGGEPYEITTLRQDVETDGRHAQVAFVRDFEVDAARRDFTMNAMSADLDGTVHDYFGGLQDLRSGQVRFVGDAVTRMQEDYLRILRFFRFRTRFRQDGDSDDPATINAVRACAPGLQRISGERIWQEMSKILVAPAGAREIALMASLKVADEIGLAPTTTAITTMGRAVAHGAAAGAALGVLAGERTLEVCKAWKLSTADTDAALFAAGVAVAPQEDPHFWRCELADGLPADVAIPVLLATGRPAAAGAVRDGVPEFPVRGRDLVDAGVAPGPAIGSALAELKDLWKTSEFSMGREELLASRHAAPAP